MPRYSRRQIGRARSSRRTNWMVGVPTNDPLVVDPNSQEDVVLLDPSDSAQEISKYVSPTIVRIRGAVWADPIFAPFSSLSARIATLGYVIYVADSPIDFTTLQEQGYAQDSIMHAGVFRFYANADSAGNSVGHEHGVVWGFAEKDHVDVKAMRKLEDNRKLYITFVNDSTSTNGWDVGSLLRILVKE